MAFAAPGWTATSYLHLMAALHVPDPRSDRDALIGATALVHGLTVVTRNVSHFQPMGVAAYFAIDTAVAQRCARD